MIDYNNLPTYTQEIEVQLNGDLEIDIQRRLPTQIWFVYGVHTVVNGLAPSGRAIIPGGTEDSMYLKAVVGSTAFLNRIRLSDIIFNAASPRKFFQLDAGRFSLDISELSNPAAVTGFSVMLFFWYVPYGELDQKTLKQVYEWQRRTQDMPQAEMP